MECKPQMNVLVLLHLKRNVRHEQVMQSKPEHCRNCDLYYSSPFHTFWRDLLKHYSCVGSLCACFRCSPTEPFCRVYCGGRL
jgi:hypothetical protein